MSTYIDIYIYVHYILYAISIYIYMYIHIRFDITVQYIVSLEVPLDLSLTLTLLLNSTKALLLMAATRFNWSLEVVFLSLATCQKDRKGGDQELQCHMKNINCCVCGCG